MTKVTKAQVEAYKKATTSTADSENIVALFQDGNRKSWEVYGRYYKNRLVNCARGQKVRKEVEFFGWHKVTKKEVAEILNDNYGLTVDEFVAIENGEYEVIKEIASNEGYILQVEERIEEKENTLKEYEETFNEKMAVGKTVKSLTLTAKKIARTLNDIEELKNQIAGYQARIDSLQAEIDAASVEENAVEEEIENAQEVVIVDLSNATGSSNAENHICAVLQNKKLNSHEYMLLQIAHRMIADIAAGDRAADILVARGEISRELYEMTAYTAEDMQGGFQFENREEARLIDELMFAAGVDTADYRLEWGRGILRSFDFNRNAAAVVVIYALKLAGVKAKGKINYTAIEEITLNFDNSVEEVAIEEELENLLDEIDNGNFAVKVAESRIEKVQAEFNEVKDTAEQAKAKEIQFWLNCAKAEIDNAEERIAYAMKDIDRKSISGAKAEIARMIERIKCAGTYLDHVTPILADVEESAAVKFEVGKVYFTKNYADCYGSTMLFKVVNRDNQKVTLQYFETPPRHCVGEHKSEKYTISTKGNVECVYISEGYTLCAKDLHNGKYAGVNATDDKYETLEIVDGVIQESVEVEELPTIDKLKAKAAEQKKPRKSIIDWTATLKDYTKQDIRILQNDLKRFIELGEIELATKMFETIKEKYRALYAA